MKKTKYFPKRLDLKPLGKALGLKIIPNWFYKQIIAYKNDLQNAMNKLEKASEVSPFPPTVIIPEALYDIDYNQVIHARVTLHKGKMNFVYLIIELSAPSLFYMDNSIFLGLLAHEFLHYVVQTINFKKRFDELEAKGNNKAPILIGNILDKEKKTIKQRDMYYYSDPVKWFNDNEIIKAVEKLDDKKIKTTTMTNKVMKWIKGGKPSKEYKRGSLTGIYGDLWLHPSILEIASKKGMI